MRRLLGVTIITGLASLLVLASLLPFGRSFERTAGLTSLYALRGDADVPDEAFVVALNQVSADWFRLQADDFSRRAPGLDSCLTPHAKARLADIRNATGVPRGLHACLVRLLTERGVSLIVFDILFHRDDPDDTAFSAALAETGNALLFEGLYARTDSAGGPEAFTVVEQRHPNGRLSATAKGTGAFVVLSPVGDYAEAYRTDFSEFPGLRDLASLARGHLSEAPPPALTSAQPFWQYGPPLSIAHYSIASVFDRESTKPLPDDLSGKVAFVGLSDPLRPGAQDHFASPISGPHDVDIAGVELMATAFLNQLHGHQLHALPLGWRITLLSAFGLALAVACLLLPGLWGIAGVLGLTLAYGGAAWISFALFHLWLPFAVPVYLGGGMGLLLAFAIRYGFASRLLGHLVPPEFSGDVVSFLSAGVAPRRTGEATVLFADIVGSMTLAESLGESRYDELLAVFHNTGFETGHPFGSEVVEFQGDGVLTACLHNPNRESHALRTIQHARALLRRVAEQNANGELPAPIALRIALHSGQVKIGRVGARARYSYKISGLTVSIAARIESIAKSAPEVDENAIVMSETSKIDAGLHEDETIPLGAHKIRGVEEPMRLYLLKS